jgi:acyl-CoA hydrolase
VVQGIEPESQIVVGILGTRQYSGVVVRNDVVAGTSLSPEHTSLMCQLSTALVEGARPSRIISGMNSHAVATTPRALTRVIVSEYGCAGERGRSVCADAQAMIAVAHPVFRDGLSAGAELLGR